MTDMIITDDIEKDYEYKLDKRDKKPRSVKEFQQILFWKQVSENN